MFAYVLKIYVMRKEKKKIQNYIQDGTETALMEV